jgi:hypothetical protein
LEFVRTQELLRRSLPVPPATVLDGWTNYAEFETAGLRDVAVLGVEGAATMARLLESDPRMISSSFHFLAFGRV